MPFSFGDGVLVALLSMLIVFLILVLLAAIISGLQHLPGGKEETKAIGKPAGASAGVGASESTNTASASISAQSTSPLGEEDDDEEDRIVAMLVASCMAKESMRGDVRVVSCERVK